MSWCRNLSDGSDSTRGIAATCSSWGRRHPLGMAEERSVYGEGHKQTDLELLRVGNC